MFLQHSRALSVLILLFFTSVITAFSQVNFDKFPQSYELIPRDLDSNKGSFEITGNMQYGGFDAVRAKVLQEGNLIQTVDQNVYSSSATFNLSILIPAITKNHSVEFYTIQNGQEQLIRSSENVVSGDIYLVNGQSNAEANVIMDDQDKNPFSRGTNASGQWVELRYSNPGMWAGRIANQIIEAYDIPVAFFNFARGGTRIDFFLPDFEPTSTNNFNSAFKTLTDLGIQNDIRSVLFFQGETDGWQATIDSYKNDFKNLVGNWRSTYNLKHVYYFQIRSFSCTHPYPYVLEAQRQAAASDLDLHVMSTANARHDGCHFDYDGGYQDLGDRMFRLMANDLYNGSFNQAESPDIQSAKIMGDSDLELSFPSSNSFSSSGNPWADFNLEPSGVKPYSGYLSGNKVILKFAQTIPDDAKITYRCHKGYAEDYIFNQSDVGLLSFYNFDIQDGGSNPDSCSNDNEDPIFSNCPNNILVTTNGGGQNVNWTPPSASDNCSAVNLTSNYSPGQYFAVGNYIVKYTAFDQAQNSSTCSFEVKVALNSANNNCNNNLLQNGDLSNSAGWSGGFNMNYNNSIGSNVQEICQASTAGNARQIISESAGGSYRLVVNARTINATGFIRLKFLNSSYTPLATKIETITSSSFTEYTVLSTAPSGTAFIEVSIEKDNSGNGCLQASNWCLTKENGQVSCAISASINNLACDDNQSSNTSDDEFSFDLLVNGQNNGSSWRTIVNGQVIVGNYNQSKNIKAGLINNGTINLVVNDLDDSSCSTQLTVVPPSSCSGNNPQPPISNCNNNLVDNGGFENGLNGWTILNDGQLSAQSISGNTALRLRPNGNRALRNIPVTAGEEFTLNASVRGTGDAEISIKFLNDQWIPLDRKTERINLSGETTNFSGLEAVAPTDAENLEISLFNRSTSNIFFDDVCLTYTDHNGGGTNPINSYPVDCEIESDYPWEEWISEVKLGGITRTSSKAIYSNYASTIFPIAPENNRIKVTTMWSYLTNPLFIAIYIDWNQDENFSDDEKLDGQITAPIPGSGVSNSLELNFDRANGAVGGLAKMRVIASRNPVLDPCSNVALGEVEDYLVNISSQDLRLIAPSNDWIDQVLVFPNPALNYVTIDYSKLLEQNVNFFLSNAIGEIVPNKFVQANSSSGNFEMQTSDLEDGIYFLHICPKGKKPKAKKLVVMKVR